MPGSWCRSQPGSTPARDAEIADDTGLNATKVAELREAVHLSTHMRQPSRQPNLARFLTT
ncbi:MAG: hypothetical protein ACYC1E_09670 [Propionibacteriaceae bacterium]